jgi:hypothetical protein
MINPFTSYHKKEKNWVTAFLISHLFGWIVAWIQTIWLVREIRKYGRNAY